MNFDQLPDDQPRPSEFSDMSTTRRAAASGGGTVISVHGRVFSSHALSRCGQMHVDLADVVEVLRTPERSYPSGGRHTPNRRVAAGNGLAVVVGEHDGAVITVLWDRQTHR